MNPITYANAITALAGAQAEAVAELARERDEVRAQEQRAKARLEVASRIIVAFAREVAGECRPDELRKICADAEREGRSG